MTDSPPETSHGTGPDGDPPTATLPPVAELPTPDVPPAPPAPPAASAPSGGGLPSWAPFAAIGAVIVAVIAVVLALTVFSGGDDETAAYRDKVSTVMAPVITANKQLSTSLAALHGTSSAAAQRKVAAAESATIAARGGLAALTVPDGADQTALNARQTLTREAGYLQAVKAALVVPAADSAAQTQTLAANLTGALDTVAPAGKDWSQSVSGSDTLTTWAPKAAATIRARKAAAARKRAAAARRARARSRSGSSAPRTSPAPSAPSAPSGGNDCGGGLHAGPNTTCAFALNVRRAWLEAPGTTNTLRVYSPVTGQTYTMSCAPAGGGITCSGANNASVSWD
jgi:hypothetical protein